MPNLSTPLQIGDLTLNNRVIMAPLTRCRASEGRVPNELMAKYYEQRASAGLIISEATVISEEAVGYQNTPGIWSQEQVVGWKKITQAVHEQGGKIFCQLWHVGRISHESLLKGATPVAPCAIKPKGQVSHLRPKVEYPNPRELSISEIKEIVWQFKNAAKNAKEAGFDGIELHAANGYLIDQFLQDSTNKRTDEYGGTLENRVRFLLEIVDACNEVWNAGHIGVHLAPRADAHDMGDSNPQDLFRFVAAQLDARKIGFICAREYDADDSILPIIREAFSGVLIANEKFNRKLALDFIQKGKADAVAFGCKYISNPDLAKRFIENHELNQENYKTFYFGGEKGYTDYPFLK